MHSGPVTDKLSTLADVPDPLVALSTPSPLQQNPPAVPVFVQPSMLTVMSAVQLELPATVEMSFPLNSRHSQS